MYSVFLALFFFFQAEDGIRAGHVTGVQTCALPISPKGSATVNGIGRSLATEYAAHGRASRVGTDAMDTRTFGNQAGASSSSAGCCTGAVAGAAPLAAGFCAVAVGGAAAVSVV